MKLRYFYRIDNQGKPILASNIRRKSKPFNGGRWKELFNMCCNPQFTECTCGFRYFVQLDQNKNPVDYTLIKRLYKPDLNEGIHFMEINWADPCCG